MIRFFIFCLGILGIAVVWYLIPVLPVLLKMICSTCCGVLWAEYYVEWML